MSGLTDRRRTAAARDTSPDGDAARRGRGHGISRRLVIVAAGVSVTAALAGGGLTVVNGGKISQSIPLVFGLAVPYAILGAFLAGQRPESRMGWVLYAPGAVISLTLLGSGYADLSVTNGIETRALGHLAGWFAEWSWMLILPLAALVLLLFPDGRPPTPRWRWVQTTQMLAVVVVAPLAAIALWPIRGDLPTPPDVSTDELVPPLADALFLVFAALTLTGLIAAIAAMAVRFRRASSDLRHQMKWFFTAAGFLVVSTGLLFSGLVGETLAQLVVAVAFLAVPVAIAVAVLRYRLYDIDIVISRTLVFAGLTAFITAIYVSIVVGVGSLLGAGDEPNLALSIVATALVAVAFQPVRERLTRLANRLVFGKRATPYEVLSRFSSHLGDTVATEDTLQRMGRLLADGTGAAHAQVSLAIGGQMIPATSVGQVSDASAEAHTVEVTHQGETLGALSVTKKRGETLTPADVKLVDDLAAQAGLLLRNVRLTEQLKAKIVELRASRQRLVAAQDAERRRLERDLHDGAQQQIVAMKLKVGMARTVADRLGADELRQLLDQLWEESDEAVEMLRNLAHGIYPPLLQSEGLAAALTSQARKTGLPVSVEAGGLGRYDREVEATVYFCVSEALQNVAKYADPTRVAVRLEQADGHLEFTVADDGNGFDPATTPKGHGTTNLADRLDALGGELGIRSAPGAGTTVSGRVPAAATPRVPTR